MPTTKRKFSSGTEGRSSKRRRLSSSSVDSKVKSALLKNSDVKYHVYTRLLNGALASGEITEISSLTRGSGNNNFIGNSITPKHVRVRYAFQSAGTNNLCRVIIFQWHDSSVPVPSGIIASTGALSPLEPIRAENKRFMTVLHDRTIAIANNGVNNVFDYHSVFISSNRLAPIIFKTGSDTTHKGAIYLLVVSDDLVTTYPQFEAVGELAFVDV